MVVVAVAREVRQEGREAPEVVGEYAVWRVGVVAAYVVVALVAVEAKGVDDGESHLHCFDEGFVRAGEVCAAADFVEEAVAQACEVVAVDRLEYFGESPFGAEMVVVEAGAEDVVVASEVADCSGERFCGGEAHLGRYVKHGVGVVPCEGGDKVDFDGHPSDDFVGYVVEGAAPRDGGDKGFSGTAVHCRMRKRVWKRELRL